jgi:hypothetical protein
VSIRHLRKVTLLSINNLYILAEDSSVWHVNIKQLRREVLININDQCIWGENSNVQPVNIRQLRKLTLFVTRNLYIWAENKNGQSVKKHDIYRSWIQNYKITDINLFEFKSNYLLECFLLHILKMVFFLQEGCLISNLTNVTNLILSLLYKKSLMIFTLYKVLK